MKNKEMQTIVRLGLYLAVWLGSTSVIWAQSEAFSREQDGESEFQQLPDASETQPEAKPEVPSSAPKSGDAQRAVPTETDPNAPPRR